MANAITPLHALHFYLWLTTSYPYPYNYNQKPLCSVVVDTAQQRKQMTNITTIYSQANHGSTMRCASKWFVWIPGSVTMVKMFQGNTHCVALLLHNNVNKQIFLFEIHVLHTSQVKSLH